MTSLNPMTVYKKLQNLVWAYVKPSKRDAVRDVSGYVQYIDPSHVMIVELFDDGTEAGATPKTYMGYYPEGTIKVPKIDHESHATFNRDMLMSILDNLTGETVRLYVSTDYPIKICGECGDKHVIALVAPRIECDPEEIDKERELTDVSPSHRQPLNTPDMIPEPVAAPAPSEA